MKWTKFEKFLSSHRASKRFGTIRFHQSIYIYMYIPYLNRAAILNAYMICKRVRIYRNLTYFNFFCHRLIYNFFFYCQFPVCTTLHIHFFCQFSVCFIFLRFSFDFLHDFALCHDSFERWRPKFRQTAVHTLCGTGWNANIYALAYLP